MKKAYYIMGSEMIYMDIEHGRYVPETPFNLEKEMKLRFLSIQKKGYIDRSLKVYEFADDLVGLTDYVSLVVGQCRHEWETLVKEMTFGFIFNAQKLIERGALLSIQNIAEDYDCLVDDVTKNIAQVFVSRTRQESETPFETSGNTERTQNGENLREDSQQRERFLRDLFIAIEDNNLEFPGCRQAIEEIREQFQALRAKKILRGKRAVEYLNTVSDDEHSEILVWKQLPLIQAIGIVQQGEEINFLTR